MTNFSIHSDSQYKSVEGLRWDNIPSFSVITGLNGAGKSHLLEMIAASFGFSINGRQVRGYENAVKISGLNVGAGDLLYVEASKDLTFNDHTDIGVLEARIQQIYNRPNQDSSLSWRAAGKLYEGFQKNNERLYEKSQYVGPSIEQFRTRLTPSIICSDKLVGQMPDLALLFFSYALLAADARGRGVSDKEIINSFGAPPWELLNEIFAAAGLNLRAEEPNVPMPSLFSPTHRFSLRLYDTSKDIRVSPNELSSGEKKIVAMVFLHYTLNFGRSKYRLLLLDEPDAHLHPAFIKKFLKILADVFVAERRVNVIMTSHSPVTVALSPESAIFIMDRFKNNAPKKVSRAHALGVLLAGVPGLNVQYEDRRQIFVESKYDVMFFERLYSALQGRHQFDFQPVFLEPHSGSSNCSDVTAIVKKLRKSGSDLVFGVIDYDTTNKSTDTIFVLGGEMRYAIDNYILDPIYLALTLIRYHKKKFTDFGVAKTYTYTKADVLTQSECQAIVNSILQKCGFAIQDLISVTWENGFVIEYPRAFLLFQGHAYENIANESFVELNAVIKKGQGDASLKLAVLDIIVEYPQFLPVEIAKTFHKILSV